MTTNEYARALHDLFREYPDGTLGKRFAAYLKERGKSSMLPSIVRELEHINSQALHDRTCEISVSIEHELHDARTRAKELMRGEGHEDPLFQEYIDHSLIGGYVIRTPKQEIDESHKKSLYQLYQHLRSAL